MNQELEFSSFDLGIQHWAICRSTAAGYVATESKTKPRSKKTNRLLAGRNNDRKVNNLNWNDAK